MFVSCIHPVYIVFCFSIKLHTTNQCLFLFFFFFVGGGGWGGRLSTEANKRKIIVLPVKHKSMFQPKETRFTLYLAQSVVLLKASVAMTFCNSSIWVAPHGARYFRAYVIARKSFPARTNSMNSWSLNWNSNLLCHHQKHSLFKKLTKNFECKKKCNLNQNFHNS